MFTFKGVVTFTAVCLIVVTVYEIVSWTLTLEQVFGSR